MTQPLFIQSKLTFEKLSAEVGLSEDPNLWPHEVVQELYKQVPYIADFDPHVEMKQVDNERGYGLGEVTLSTKSEAQQGTDPAMLDAAGIRAVRIPVVIKERKLNPFDLMVNDVSKVLPLTEARLRTALFRPQMFDVTSQTPGDQSMIGQLYPPYRQNYGFGGGGVTMGAGMGKSASSFESFLAEQNVKTASVVEEKLIKELEAKDAGFRKIAFRRTSSMCTATFSTFNRCDLDGFFSKLAADDSLQAAYSRNSEAVLGPLSLFAHNEPVSLEKRAEAVGALLPPSVTQLTKTPGGYMVKSANYKYWRPVERELSRRDALLTYGEKVVLAADEAGQVTIAADAAQAPVEAPLDAEEPMPVAQAGLYKVTTEAGQELVGVVVPNLLDVDGTPLPITLFTNGSHTAVQPDVLGVPAGASATLPTGAPSGAGAFFSQAKDGQLQATIPLTLQGSYAMPGEPATFQGETFDGRPVEVSVQPNIQTIMGTPEGKLLVPAHWQWTPLGAAESVGLVGTESSNELPDDWTDDTRPAPELEENLDDVDSDAEKESHVFVRGDHDCFTFEGPGVAKLAAAEIQMVGLDQAMFLLGALGVHQHYGLLKLGASFNEAQRVKTARRIVPAAEQDAWAMRQAEKCASIAPFLKKDLMKEAAVIPDPTAVDAVLSLGFINPENIMTFVSYLPTLEDAQAKMCELLLAARIGLSDIPASALERAVRSTEETIEGLKVLAFQG